MVCKTFAPSDHGLTHTYTSPGRLFAAIQLKTMLAYVLLNYDVKMADDGGRPSNLRMGAEMAPDTTAEVLFRKRINHI